MKAHEDSPLSKADGIVGGSRCETYGKPFDNHTATAALWSDWFSRKTRVNIVFDAVDVCMFNILQKCSREANKHHDDNMVDICGYAQNDWLCRDHEKPPIITGHEDARRDSVLNSNPDPILPMLNENQKGGVIDEPLRFYVSGPFTAPDANTRAKNIIKAKIIALTLAFKGHSVHCPHAATEFMDGHLPYQYFMDLDETIVKLWSNANFNIAPSPGANREVVWSLEKEDPVYTNLVDVPIVKGFEVNASNHPTSNVEQEKSPSNPISIVDEVKRTGSDETVCQNAEHQPQAKSCPAHGGYSEH